MVKFEVPEALHCVGARDNICNYRTGVHVNPVKLAKLWGQDVCYRGVARSREDRTVEEIENITERIDATLFMTKFCMMGRVEHHPWEPETFSIMRLMANQIATCMNYVTGSGWEDAAHPDFHDNDMINCNGIESVEQVKHGRKVHNAKTLGGLRCPDRVWVEGDGIGMAKSRVFREEWHAARASRLAGFHHCSSLGQHVNNFSFTSQMTDTLEDDDDEEVSDE